MGTPLSAIKRWPPPAGRLRFMGLVVVFLRPGDRVLWVL